MPGSRLPKPIAPMGKRNKRSFSASLDIEGNSGARAYDPRLQNAAASRRLVLLHLVVLHSVVFLHAVVLFHRVFLRRFGLFGFLGVVLLHRIVFHRVIFFHAVLTWAVLLHGILGKG